MQRVLVVSEGSPGHDAQARGLLKELRERYPQLELDVVQIYDRLSGMRRCLARWLMGLRGRPLPEPIKRLFVRLDSADLDRLKKPDFVLSSGGQSVVAAWHLADHFSVPYVFIGERKPYPTEWFHTVLTPSPLEQGVNDFAIDLIPTGVSPCKVEAAAAAYELPQGRYWTMVIGGESKSHHYAEQDWVELAQGMNQLAREQGIRWLLTTSRRTGAHAEELLKQFIDPVYLADSVWWSVQPRKVMNAFLGHAELVFVTQDSVTMVSECAASGKSLAVLAPQAVHFSDTSFVLHYLERLEQKGLSSRYGISDFAGESYEFLHVARPQVSVFGVVADALLNRLDRIG